MSAQTACRFFNGYKPCPKSPVCSEKCPHFKRKGQQILLIHLGALGAVVRSTALLPAILRKYPDAQITWITQAPAQRLLQHHPLIEKVFTISAIDMLSVQSLHFDVVFCVDKSLSATALAMQFPKAVHFGFTHNQVGGAIIPRTPSANELWQMGLDNDLKFFGNKKPETQLTAEALELPYQRDPYSLFLTSEEKQLSVTRRQQWDQLINPCRLPILGINVGCSSVIPYKKLSVQGQIQLILSLWGEFAVPVVLLGGGQEDLNLANEIFNGLQDAYLKRTIQMPIPCLISPMLDGLRDGMVSMKAVDLVWTGDSLGLHMSIALQKKTLAWFGPTCAHEIDFFDQGEAILTQSTCSPCWKRNCQKTQMCYDDLPWETVHQKLCSLVRQFLSTRQHSGEISYSVSPS